MNGPQPSPLCHFRVYTSPCEPQPKGLPMAAKMWSQPSFSFSMNMLGWTLTKAIISPNLKCNNPPPRQFNILKSGSIVQSVPNETFPLPLPLPHPLTCYQTDGIFELKNPLSPSGPGREEERTAGGIVAGLSS